MKTALVTIENTSIGFPAKGNVLHSIDLQINSGEVLAIVGESGSGKSLSALALMGLLPNNALIEKESKFIWYDAASNSRINLLELNEQERRKYRGKEMSMIFQEPMTSLNPVFTCGAQVVEAMLLHQSISEQAAESAALSLFEKVKLQDPKRVFAAYPHELSGGQKQRVMIAMAICNRPKLLIADEPTTALDVTLQKGVLALLSELQSDFGMSMIFISHDLGVVAELADRVAVMYKGSIVEEGTVQQIFEHAKHPYTQSLLACSPSQNNNLHRLPTSEDFMSESDDETRASIWKDSSKTIQEVLQTLSVKPQKDALATSPLMLRVQNVRVAYPGKPNWWGKRADSVVAVNDVSFDIHQGELMGLVGESGCGKTTLSNTILGLQAAENGKILFKGQDLLGLSPRAWRSLRKEIQIVFQDPYAALNPRMRIGDAIMEPMLVHNIESNKGTRMDLAAHLLAQVRLSEDFLQRYPHQLSGGQRQRAVIARALSVNPSFIVFDECVSALDVSVQAMVLNLIADLRDSFGFCGLFISHDLSVVRFISDRIMVMQHGSIVEQGDADAVFRNPQHVYTQALLSAIPGGSFG